jgi:hypothetical protein
VSWPGSRQIPWKIEKFVVDVDVQTGIIFGDALVVKSVVEAPRGLLIERRGESVDVVQLGENL